MNHDQVKNQRTSTVIAAQIFHSLRPLIEAAVGLMPEEFPARRLMRDLQLAQMKELDGQFNASNLQSSNISIGSGDFEESYSQKLGLDMRLKKLKKAPLKRKKAELGMKRGRKPKTYLINGEQKTLAAWSIESGISYTTLIKRLKDGVPLDSPKGKAGRKKTLTISYESPVGAQNFELSADDTIAERKRKIPLITINDETKSVYDWSKECGVNTSTIIARLARGWDPQRAIQSSPMPRGRRGPRSLKALSNDSFDLRTAQVSPKVILRKKTEFLSGNEKN